MGVVEERLSADEDELLDEAWARRSTLARWVVTSVAVALAALVATVVVWQVDSGVADRRADSGPESPHATASHVAGAEPEVVTLVREWDRNRAAAWSAGDRRGLLALYAPGAGVGRSDAARLHRWARAGWTVEDAAPQLREVSEVSRTDTEWVVDVTDQLNGARAVKGEESVRLPVGTQERRRIVFVRPGDAWVVSDVRAASPLAQRG